MASDVNRHSPSVSSERSDRSSIAVPPRTKKLTHNNSQSSATIASITSSTATTPSSQAISIQPPPPPNPSAPVGRAPLPPPRKSNHRFVLHSD